ncbi:MAG: hypothetical protein R3182_10355, partial [Draconibacterium sp.]|nr:hypothetical protein [Draconibacterium sp.]
MNKNICVSGNSMFKNLLFSIICILFFASCEKSEFIADFNQTNNRIWIGEDFLSVPLEEWQVKDGRLECVGNQKNKRVNLLTTFLNGKGDVKVEMNLGLNKMGEISGRAGISLGLSDETDHSIKSLCFYGTGTDVGINTDGYIFIEQSRKNLPTEFDYEEIKLEVNASGKDENCEISLIVTDRNGKSVSLQKSD